MPSQFSISSRRAIDDALDRAIARQDDEMDARAFLAECDAFRNKIARKRILESVRESVHA